MFSAPKPQPAPPTPLPYKSSQDGAAVGAAQLAQVAAGGYNSYNPTGGMGVPSVSTSSAKLLGL
jgi:hypothetical protein